MNAAQRRVRFAEVPVTLKVKVAGPSAAPLAARRSQAALWAAALTGVTALFAYAALRLVPRPPGAGGAPPPPHGPAGVGADAACGILGMAAAMCVGLQLLQELLLRPLILHSGACKAISEAVFYASSLLVRCAFAAALAYYHFGPDWSHSASGAPHARGRAGYITAGVAAGGGGHTLTTALFVAAYVSDILQLTTRQDEFARGFVHTSVLHRYLSLGWAALWLMLLAPQGPGGAPIFNAATMYLTSCLPLDAYKLASCYHAPKWAPLLALPALMCHWALLLASQAYLFSQCPASPLGCWDLGTITMLLGGWGLAAHSLAQQWSGAVLSGSKALGAPIRLSEIPALLAGRDPLLEGSPNACRPEDRCDGGGSTSSAPADAGGGAAARPPAGAGGWAWGGRGRPGERQQEQQPLSPAGVSVELFLKLPPAPEAAEKEEAPASAAGPDSGGAHGACAGGCTGGCTGGGGAAASDGAAPPEAAGPAAGGGRGGSSSRAVSIGRRAVGKPAAACAALC